MSACKTPARSNVPALDVRSLARQHDYPHYIASLFVPKKQELLWHLLALMAELHHAVIVAREPLAGHMRLAWWREQLQADVLRGHPLLDALQALSYTHALSKIHLHALVDGYSALLEVENVEDIGALLDVGAGLYAPLYRMICPDVPDALLMKFARMDGAQMLLYGSPLWHSLKKNFFPTSCLQPFGMSVEDMLQGDVSLTNLRHISHTTWLALEGFMPEPCTAAYPAYLHVMRRVMGMLSRKVLNNPLVVWQDQKQTVLASLPIKLFAVKILPFLK